MAKSKVDQLLAEMEAEAGSDQPAAATATGLLPLGNGSSVGLGAPLASSGGDALAALWSPDPATAPNARKTVEDILVAKGKLDQEKLLQARSVQNTSKS